MTVEFRPISDAIGAEILGVDLAKPVAPETFREIRKIWLAHNIILFRRQIMTPEQQIAFSRHFGEIELHTLSDYQMPGYPEIFINSNVVVNGKPVGAQKSGRFWHSDSQFLRIPSAGTLLFAKEVPPEEGDTLYANMYQAYDTLPEKTKKRIEGLKATYSRVKAWEIGYKNRAPMTPEQKAKFPDVTHPLVRTHPETGRRALYIGAWEERVRVEGLPAAEGEALGKELYDWAIQPRFAYAHHWEVGDLIVWDNRCAMHCAMPFDESKYRRLMHRCTIVGTVPSL
ncbi:MAG: TauD/TfdA family dioxygenase [Rhodospirillales bacterium]|nr:TauD/TfdA family dioxygenase [Rhodospirillales bacterium]